MKISDIMTPDHIFSNIECNSKKAVMELLAKYIASFDNAISQTEVIDCLITRERLGSTGLGNGIAIPHGRLKYSKKTIAIFMQLNNGIDYGAIDEIPVDLIFALIVPEKSTDEHLQILAVLAEKLSDIDTIDALRDSKDPEEIFTTLVG